MREVWEKSEAIELLRANHLHSNNNTINPNTSTTNGDTPELKVGRRMFVIVGLPGAKNLWKLFQSRWDCY